MRFVIALAALFVATVAHADLRDLCPTRPGLDTPPCTVDPGHAVAELGLVDWTHDGQGSAGRSDTLATGQMLVRYGLDARTEVQLGWTAFTHVRARDATGVAIQSGVGDVTVALKHGLSAANGPVAIQAYVSAPTASGGVGAGAWQSGVLLPVAIDVGHGLGLAVTPRIDWLANGSDDRHHLSYGSAFGVSDTLTKRLTVALEGSVVRDTDPAGATTPVLASLSLAWQPEKNTQFDLGAVKAVASAPDIELYLGVSRRF